MPEENTPVETLPVETPDWKSTLPEEFKTNPLIEQTKDIGSLASQAISSESELGKARTRIKDLEGSQGAQLPTGESTPEAWAELFKTLGRPEDAAGYGFEKPDLPAEVQYDEKLDGWFAEAALKADLLPKQANALRDEWNTIIPEMQKADLEAKYKAGEETLKSEFGVEGYKQTLNEALTVLKQNVAEAEWPALAQELDQSMLTYSPRLVSSLKKIFDEHYSEAEVIDGKNAPTSQSLKEMEIEFEGFMKENGSKLVNNDNSREHQEIKQRYQDMQQKLVRARLAMRK